MDILERRIQVGDLEWFVREVDPDRGNDGAPQGAERHFPPVLLLHGLISQSYGWLPILKALGEQGFRALAPDWIGSGFSAKPERWQFDYRPQTLQRALAEWVEAQSLERFSLVVQGFLGSVGLQYALKNPDRIERLIILNTPIGQGAKLPWSIRAFGIPLLGDMLTQDPLLVDRTLETGGIYQVKDKDLDVYRRPFLTTSASGRALLATVQNLSLPQVMKELEAGFSDWKRPTLIAWGMQDRWLPFELVTQLCQRIPKAQVVKLEQVGHYPQHDWPQKVQEAVIPFLRKLIV